jgi:hypothetical protein
LPARLATSVFDYEFYWRGMKDEWNRLKEKKEARTLLSEAIVSDRPLHPLYPLETKIMELSHIGYKHGRAEPSHVRSLGGEGDNRPRNYAP